MSQMSDFDLRDSHVKEIHAVTSLSPGLDKAAIDTVRSWKFKGCQDEPLCNDGNFKTHLKDLGSSLFSAQWATLASSQT